MNKNNLVKLILVFVVAIVGALMCASCNTEQNLPEYTLIYSAETGGNIVGEAEQIISEYSDGTGVTAIPDEGYKFEKWSDGITTPERQELNVTKDITVTAIFTKLNYFITYKTDGNGTIKGEANQAIAYGENGTEVKAIPNEGYKFVKWSDDSIEQTRIETGVKANITLTANFEKLFYTVKYNISGNGMIEGETNQTINFGGNCTTVKAIPADGYRFVKWSDGNAEQERTDTNIISDIVITAIFERLTYVVLYETDGNGTIKGETNQTVAYGDNTTTITAMPNAGYAFVQWSDGKVEPTRQETDVKESLTLTAIFEKLLYTVKYSAYENGTIEGETSQIIAYGESAATVRAVPNEGYRFVRWSDGVTKAERTDVEINRDINVKAEFTVLSFVVNYGIEGNGTIEGEAVQIVLYGEDCSEVKAVPNEGYAFVRWSDGNTNPTRQDINVKEHIAVTAIFDNTFTVTYMTEGNGTIEGEANQSVKYGRWNSTVKAVPDEGYRFVKWSDGYTNPVRAELVYENISVTAIFEVLVLKVTYRVNGGYFMVNGENEYNAYTQYVDYGCDTTLKLKPILNNSESEFTYKYVFLKWSDGVEVEERQDFNVTENIVVTAIFGIKLTYAIDGNKGGKLLGNCTQIIEEGSDAEKITAIADNGFVFDGWSDWSENSNSPERQDKNVEKSANYVAYFAPIEKIFVYDYGENFGIPLTNKVIINRYKLNEAQFVLPEMQGYTFCGWYADKEFKTMFANENGKLMLGYYTFNLETDTIYARWKRNDAEYKLTYKVLTVCVEELHHPELKVYKDDDLCVDMHFKSTAIRRRLYSMYSPKVAEYLNDWFEGSINFEVDTYFTTDVIDGKEYLSVDAITSPYVTVDYWLFDNINRLPEISDLLHDDRNYRNVIAIYDFSPEYNFVLHAGACGLGSRKYGEIYSNAIRCAHNMDELYIHEGMLRQEFDYKDSKLWYEEITVYMHEFCHTIRFKYGVEVCDYHKVDYRDQMLESKLYLLCKAEVDGKYVGIPSTYWTEGGKYMF